MLREFKEFASRGNVVDLAVGVIIGGAFGKIVTSLVNDLVMPLLGLLVGRIDLTTLKLVLRPARDTTTELAITYGVFLQNTLDFLIISFSIFIVLRFYNKFQKKKEPVEESPPPPKTSKEEQLLTEIRDLIKERQGN
jgi:large conductance mechanosensitive channel